MNENIDLTKILKDCPEGWKFYSSVYGEVEFVEIMSNITDYPVTFKLHGSTHIGYVSFSTFISLTSPQRVKYNLVHQLGSPSKFLSNQCSHS